MKVGGVVFVKTVYAVNNHMIYPIHSRQHTYWPVDEWAVADQIFQLRVVLVIGRWQAVEPVVYDAADFDTRAARLVR